MRKIISILQPFDLKQTLYVYENGNKLDIFQIETEKISDEIFKIIEKYSITEINFAGSKKYAKGIFNKIQEKELIKYNKNLLKIKYI